MEPKSSDPKKVKTPSPESVAAWAAAGNKDVMRVVKSNPRKIKHPKQTEWWKNLSARNKERYDTHRRIVIGDKTKMGEAVARRLTKGKS